MSLRDNVLVYIGVNLDDLRLLIFASYKVISIVRTFSETEECVFVNIVRELSLSGFDYRQVQAAT